MNLLKITAFLFLSILFQVSTILSQEKCDTSFLKQHLTTITKREKARHFANPEVLDSVAIYNPSQVKILSPDGTPFWTREWQTK